MTQALTPEQAKDEKERIRALAKQFDENEYWQTILKPMLEKAEKLIETKILNGQCESTEDYKTSCTQREVIKNTFAKLAKDLQL